MNSRVLYTDLHAGSESGYHDSRKNAVPIQMNTTSENIEISCSIQRELSYLQ